jgi:hypothetical protein
MQSVAAGVVLVLLGSHVGWNIHASRRLSHEVEIARRSGATMSLAEFFPAQTAAAADNAALDLRAAYRAMSSGWPLEPHPAWKRLGELEPPYDDVRLSPPLSQDQLSCLREIVRLERRALRHVDDACRKPALEWPTETPPALVLFRTDDLAEQRRVAELLRVAALCAHAEGDYAEAIRRVRQLLFVSAALEKIPDETGHRAALYTSGTACELLTAFRQEDDGIGPAHDTRAQIALLLDESPLRAGWRLVLCAQRAQYVDTLSRVAEGRITSEVINMPRPPWRVLRHLWKPMLRNDAALLCRLTSQVLDASEEPTWPAFQGRQPDMSAAVLDRFPLHGFACILGHDESQLAELHYRGLTRRRMAAVALAVRWYAADHHGQRPRCLQDLVPGYLPNVPADPLAADTRPLGYRADADRPIVYSVGNNGTDEAGSDLRPALRYLSSLGATEDEVLYLDERPPTEVRKEVWPFATGPR